MISFRLMQAVVSVALIAASPAVAGTIRGTIHTPALADRAAPAGNGYPGSAATMPGMRAMARGLASDAVVYITHLPAEVDSAIAVPPARPRLAQQGQAFVPRVLAVAVGTEVDFPNMDPIYHNVFSLSPVRRFDLGKYPRGHSKTVKFNHTGLVNVYCDIHSDMAAFVLVLQNHAFAQPGADGTYALPELPAGRYELKVWHPDLSEVTRVVEVVDRGVTTVDVSF